MKVSIFSADFLNGFQSLKCFHGIWIVLVHLLNNIQTNINTKYTNIFEKFPANIKFKREDDQDHVAQENIPLFLACKKNHRMHHRHHPLSLCDQSLWQLDLITTETNLLSVYQLTHRLMCFKDCMSKLEI